MSKKFLMFSITVFIFTSFLTSIFLIKNDSLEAAIAVIDTKNIAETHAGYLEEVKVVQNTLEQIQNQIKELTSLPNNVMSNFGNGLKLEMGKINVAIDQSASGLLNPNIQPDEAWKNIFTPVESWGKSKVDYLSVEQGVILNIDRVNKDAFNILKANNTNIEEDINRITQLTQLNESVVGNKQALQVNNMLLAHANELESRKVSIMHAEATATIANYQRQNQIDAQAADRAQKLVDEFSNFKSETPKR